MLYLESFLENQNSLPIIFIGGLDNRRSKKTGKLKDLTLSQQVTELKTFCKNPIIPFRYTQHEDGLDELKSNPNCIVVLFSKGCEYSADFADVIKNKNLLFIVEPYGLGSTTRKGVNYCVSRRVGVPRTNVIVGPDPGTGSDIISGSRKNDSGYKAVNGSRHFGALKFISEIVSKLR